ncbi:MAG: hypothetical protein P1P85_05655 [Patescibacteria group bacterium]|nr:hypothetical protein [Patescibacteria group bacterium]
MKIEQQSIESTIKEIKKAEAEKEVEIAVEKFETEAVAEAIESEDIFNKFDEKLKTISEIEKLIEEIEINSEVKERKERKEKIIRYLNEIYDAAGKYEMVYSYLIPVGKKDKEKKDEYRTFDEEIDEMNKNRNNSEYNFEINYPKLDKDLSFVPEIKENGEQKVDLISDMKKIEEIEERLNGEKDEYAKKIPLKTLKIFKAKINILIKAKEGDKLGVFNSSTKAYNDINDQLVEIAERGKNQRIEFLKNKAENEENKSEMEKLLENKKFNAQEIKAFFDIAIDKADLRDFDKDTKVEVVIDEEVKSIDVRYSDPDYDHPVVLIPSNREVNGVKLLKLTEHEIICHLTANYYGHDLGLKGLSIGDWEDLHEGVAILNENRIMKKIFGEDYKLPEIQALPYYVLAMNKAKELIYKEIKNKINLEIKEKIKKLSKEGKNQKAINEDVDSLIKKRSKEIAIENIDIGEIYDYVYGLRKEEYLAEKHGKKNIEDLNAGEIEEVEKEADKKTKAILKRIFRGHYPYYFSKDKSYLEGEIIAKLMEESETDKYPTQSKVDPKMISDLIKAGVYIKSYTYKKGLKAAKDVVERMWKDNI